MRITMPERMVPFLSLEAFLYARWSTHEQGKGTTLERQRSATEAFARRQGWQIADAFHDEGISAWTGANLETGRLAKFVQ